MSSLCHQGSETGCHDSRSTTAASSRTRNLPLETRYRQNLANVVCTSVWHCQCPPFLGDCKKYPFPALLILPPCNPAHEQATAQHHSQQGKRICMQVTSCKAQATAAAETHDPQTMVTLTSPGRGTNSTQLAAGLRHQDRCDRKDKTNQT